MADRTVSVRLNAEVAGYIAKMQAAGAATANLGRQGASVASQVGLLKPGMLSLGTGVALVGVQAIRTGADFQSAMSGVQAATRATAGELDELRQAARDAGGATKYSAGEAADGITNLAKAGVSTTDILGGGLTGALSLAAAGQMDVANAAETTATALNMFGLQGSEAGHVADVLAAGAGKAMGEVSDMGQALKQSGLVASQMGWSLEETVGVLSAFAQAGLVGSDAGTSLRTMLLRLANPTKESKALLDDLGISVYDASGHFVDGATLAGELSSSLSGLDEDSRNAAMGVLFGSDAIRGANVLYTDGQAGIAGWTAKVNDAGFAAETASILTNNLSGDIEKLTGAVSDLALQTEAPLSGLRQIVQLATSAVNAMSDAGQDKGWLHWFTDSVIPTPQADGSGGWDWLFGDFGGGQGLKDALPVSEMSALDRLMPSVAESLDRAASAAADASDSTSTLGGAADAASGSLDGLGGSASGAAGSIDDLAAAQQGAIQSAWDYLSAQSNLVSTQDALVGAEGRLRSAIMGTATTVRSSVAGSKAASASASKAQREATDKRIAAIREQERAEQDAEIKAARRKAQRKADAAADAGARKDVRKGVAEAIATDKAARRGEDIDGFRQGGSVGEATGSLSKSQQKALDAEIEAIRARHTKSIDAQSKALRDVGKATRDASGSVSNATKVYLDYSASLDESTAAGVRNREAIRRETDTVNAAAQAAYQAVLTNNGTLQEAWEAYETTAERLRTKLLDDADAAGYARAEAKELIDQLTLIPESIVTELRLSGVDEAKEKVEKFRAWVKQVGKTWNPTLGAWVPGSDSTAAKGGVKRASGGEVWGPGSSTSDSVALYASAGEYVVNARQYAANRDLVRAINAGAGPVSVSGGGGSVGVHIEGGVHVTAPNPLAGARDVVDELAKQAYRTGAVR